MHVWDDDFDATRVASFDGTTFVIGGGITAVQLACHLSESTDLTLLSRHPLKTEAIEADPVWINWKHIERTLHTLPPGSAARYKLINSARNDATIPPHVADRLDDACSHTGLTIRIGEISVAFDTDDDLMVRLDDGTVETNVQIVLATGLDPIPDHPQVRTIADSLALKRGDLGFPVLNDRTLAWQHMDGTDFRVRFGRTCTINCWPISTEHRRCSARCRTACHTAQLHNFQLT